MRRLGLVLAAAMLALAAPVRAQTPTTFSPTPWLADLDQLRDAMTAGYANLEWQAQRGLDLPATYARARSRIEAARDDYEARRGFERFLTAFGDGHLEIHWPTPSSATSGPQPAQPLCSRLGYFDLADDGGPTLKLANARALGASAAHLKIAIVRSGGRKLGVLRVGMFSPRGYPDICERVAASRGLTSTSPCDEACRDAFEMAADTVFVGEMAAQLRILTAARPDALLVDIAGNGGGDESSLALARMVTARPLARGRGGGVMGAAWVKEFADREAAVAKALKTASPAERPELQRFDAALADARAEAQKSCDRSPLWRGEPISCSALAPEPHYKSFWSTVPAPDDPVAGAQTIWSGPLIVLTDGGSLSSSEWFAAILRDSRAALIIGSPTYGAGCGHMTDAPPVTLTHSGAKVSMPDCWSLRADGENEAGGVQPDVLIGLRERDTLAQKAQRLAQALPTVLARIGRRS